MGGGRWEMGDGRWEVAGSSSQISRFQLQVVQISRFPVAKIPG